MLTTKLLIFICFIATFAYGETLSKIDQKNEISTSKNDTQPLQDSLQDDSIQMKANVAVQERTAVQRREMRGRGGGSRGSSYSGSRSYYSGSSSRYSGSSSSYRSSYSPTSKYRYSYSTYKNPTSYSNSYYSKTTMRTSRPLYVYYRAPNYYNAVGYYSTVFLMVYYNGYGYNFYYGQYGYYEYSVNQRPESSGSVIGQIIGCLCCCAVCGIVCWYCKKQKHDDGSESGSEHVIEEYHVEEHHGGPPPGHYDPNMGAPPQYPPGSYPGYNPGMPPMQGQPVMGQPYPMAQVQPMPGAYPPDQMQMQQPYPQQPMMQQPYGQQPGPGGMYPQPGQPMMQQPGQPMMQQQPMYQQQ